MYNYLAQNIEGHQHYSTFHQEQKSLLQAHCNFPRPL